MGLLITFAATVAFLAGWSARWAQEIDSKRDSEGRVVLAMIGLVGLLLALVGATITGSALLARGITAVIEQDAPAAVEVRED